MSASARERGQVVVIFALLLPVMFGIGAVVLDLGNWYVHKRHLQTQVDAAALAGGAVMDKCFTDKDAGNRDARAEALEYAGDEGRVPTSADTTNKQVQEPADVRVVLNGSRYWEEGDPQPTYPPDPSPTADPYGLDWTMDGDPDTAGIQSSQPCDAEFVDVKATDVDLPLLWGLLPLTPSTKAKAKVEIHQTGPERGLLPFAIPDLNPKTVVALWVDRTETNTVDSFTFLTGPPNPEDTVVKNGKSVALWQGQTSAYLPGPPPRGGNLEVVDQTGMIVFTSRQELDASDLAGKSLAQICAMPTGFCFSGDTNTSYVDFIRGTPLRDGPVVLENAALTSDPNSFVPGFPNPPCSTTDPNSQPYFLWNADCDLRLLVEVDFGPLSAPGNEIRLDGGPSCNGGMELEDSAEPDHWWSSRWITIDAESLRHDFTLCWREGPGGKAQTGTFGNQVIQMAYAAPQTQPLAYAAIRPLGCTPVLYANALPKSTQTVCVEVGLEPPIHVSDPGDQPALLRIAGPGSLNQMVDCDDNAPSQPRGPVEEISDGCFVPYQPNPGEPRTTPLECTPGPPSYTVDNMPPEIPGPWPDPVPDCVEVSTGDKIKMAKGLHARFEDESTNFCNDLPNKWDEYQAAGELPPDSDHRVIHIFIADYGAFSGAGNEVIPIVKFAAFYVTGWFVMNSGDMTYGCPDNDPPPTPPYCPKSSTNPCAATDTEVQGAIWGYFISDFSFENAEPSEDLCNFDGLDNCIAVLVE